MGIEKDGDYHRLYIGGAPVADLDGDPFHHGTWFAAETLMGSSSEAYKYSLQGVIFDPFGATLCLVLAVSGIFSLIIALWAETIYELAILANTCILVGMVAPYVIGMYWKKANHIGALTSFFSGSISWGFLSVYYYQQTFVLCEGDLYCSFWDAVYIASTPAFIISIIAFIIVSLATGKIDPPKILKDVYGKPVDMKNALGWGNLNDLPESSASPTADG